MHKVSYHWMLEDPEKYCKTQNRYRKCQSGFLVGCPLKTCFPSLWGASWLLLQFNKKQNNYPENVMFSWQGDTARVKYILEYAYCGLHSFLSLSHSFLLCEMRAISPGLGERCRLVFQDSHWRRNLTSNSRTLPSWTNRCSLLSVAVTVTPNSLPTRLVWHTICTMFCYCPVNLHIVFCEFSMSVQGSMCVDFTPKTAHLRYPFIYFWGCYIFWNNIIPFTSFDVIFIETTLLLCNAIPCQSVSSHP